ncbi:MAG: VWA domain-containing protein [Planctomycetota bacterium]
MRFRFRAWEGESPEERFRRLLPLFEMLLLRSGGDVDTALDWLERVAERYGWFDEAYGIDDFRRDLERDGRVRLEGGTLVPTGKTERAMRERALERIFSGAGADPDGEHASRLEGGRGEPGDLVRDWRPGESLEDVAWTESFRRALARDPEGGLLGLREQDLEVREREREVSCATVLLVDVSHSMILYGEDRMSPAREVALALFELIQRRFRRDTLDLVLFGDEARRVPLDRSPYIQAGPFHTNTKAGLRMAQDILRGRRHANRRVFMITDGKPSAIERDGRIYKNPFGLDEEVVNRTLDEAVACRRAGIEVTTFMVARDPLLVEFVEEFSRLNRGRAYFTGTGGLGEAVFVDYLRHRRGRA